MMAKPKAIAWLEEQTGQTIEYASEPASTSGERHLSVRLSDDLAAGLDDLAQERKLTVSQLVRQILADAVAQRLAVASLDAQALAERLAADVAEVRRRLAG
jgi:predicted transcriptional regulator